MVAGTGASVITANSVVNPRGAYGIAFTGLGDAAGLLAAPPADWPVWAVERARADGPPEPGVAVGEGRARIGLASGGAVLLDRGRRSITFATPGSIPDAAIVHPGLSAPSAVVSWWLGRTPLHASAVIVDGRAWALVGVRGTGKSTMAAVLADSGCGFLADDLVVVDGDRAYAGPATVDLREDAAARLGAQPLGRMGTRERWRRHVRATAPEATLGGLVVLDWCDGPPQAGPATLPDRMAALATHQLLPLRPDVVLELLALPAVRLRRPQGLEHADASAAVLLAALDG